MEERFSQHSPELTEIVDGHFSVWRTIVTILMRCAIELLSDVLAGVHPPAFFQQNHIATTGLNIAPSSLNRKLNQERFTLWDHRPLAEYFQLGEEGYRVFEAEDERDFLARLRKLGIGKFHEDVAHRFSQQLYADAQQSTSTLTFTRCKNRNPERGLQGPENRTTPSGLVLSIGDSGFVENRYDATFNGLWYALLDVHCSSGALRLLNPVFEESAISLTNSYVRYPQQDVLTVDGMDSMGSHRLFALAIKDSLLDEIRSHSSRLLTLHNNRDSRDIENHFNGVLDSAAIEAMEKVSAAGLADVAVLPYTVVARNES